MGTAICKAYETCVNTEGGFRCECEEDDKNSKEKKSKCGVAPTETAATAAAADDGSDGAEQIVNGTAEGKAEHSISFGPVVNDSENNSGKSDTKLQWTPL